MAIPLLILSRFNQRTHWISYTFVTFIILFLFTTSPAFYGTSINGCPLDIHFSSGSSSDCEVGSWDGFLTNNCCGLAFEEYLQALGKRANKTGLIYLNSAEQKDCVASMNRFHGDVFSCGIEKLKSGATGCTDFRITDVVNKLGRPLTSLGESCKLLGSDRGSAKACTACLRRWEGMDLSSSSNSKDFTKAEADICRFAVLVSLTSQRVSDEKWIQAVLKCLREGSLPLDDQESTVSKRTKFHAGLWVVLGGALGVAIAIIVALWMFFRKSKGEKIPKGNDASSDFPSKGSTTSHEISIKEVYFATNNLSASNFIGQGIAGKVYGGTLTNGQPVAIKHIVNDGQMETYVREVTSLSHVRHPNLVALLGHCEGQDECFLVYELCHNGNLSEWLFGKNKTLSWIKRLEIATGCARALWFLHTYPGGCIVHRDIKPTNILICSNFQGKLSDFGLSKVITIGQSFVSSEVRGTFGYVDPEYQNNRHVNPSGDVYSFGIVLLQLLSGQRVINLDLKKPMPLSKMAKIFTMGGNVTEFADPKLDGGFSVDEFEVVFKLALSCIGLKHQRPSMGQVVLRLEEALALSTTVKSVAPVFTLP